MLLPNPVPSGGENPRETPRSETGGEEAKDQLPEGQGKKVVTLYRDNRKGHYRITVWHCEPYERIETYKIKGVKAAREKCRVLRSIHETVEDTLPRGDI